MSTSGSKRVFHREYRIFLAICLLFVAMAFIFDKPADIFEGLGRILTQRGLMVTDFISVGGLGAAIINSAIACLYGVAVLYFMGAKPDGAAIMCLWMTAGWTFRGATVLSILPMTCGVWLYSRLTRTPFSDYPVPALLCHTIAPIVSVFYFSNPIMLHLDAQWHPALNVLFGVLAGLICGFILPVVTSVTSRIHKGYTLYNVGVAGGMISMLVAACFVGAGIKVPTESMWYADRQVELAVFLYIIFAALILTGLVTGFLRNKEKKAAPFFDMKKLISNTGLPPNDFYSLVGESVYINMGLLGVIGTTWTLVLGCDLNSGALASIFSMVAFGSLGKHIKNVIPLMAGATLCALVNTMEFTSHVNALAILFSSCLAPIAGHFGFLWGMVAGFLHVLAVIYVGPITNGFNLYNNGFCSGLVALLLVPVIMVFSRKSKGKTNDNSEKQSEPE